MEKLISKHFAIQNRYTDLFKFQYSSIFVSRSFCKIAVLEHSDFSFKKNEQDIKERIFERFFYRQIKTRKLLEI